MFLLRIGYSFPLTSSDSSFTPEESLDVEPYWYIIVKSLSLVYDVHEFRMKRSQLYGLSSTIRRRNDLWEWKYFLFFLKITSR